MCVVSSLSLVQLFETPWTMACQAPLFMEFSKQEYWSGLPFPFPDLHNSGIEPRCPMFQVDSLPSKPPGKPSILYIIVNRLGYFFIKKNLMTNPLSTKL